jgi:hypothetical protein
LRFNYRSQVSQLTVTQPSGRPFATVLNGFIFRQLRRRAYLSETLVRMAEASPFGGAEVRQSAVGFDVVLTKARAG